LGFGEPNNPGLENLLAFDNRIQFPNWGWNNYYEDGQFSAASSSAPA
jgi:hypothetical protein